MAPKRDKVEAGLLVLAAGLSSRLGGQPKALARVEGHSLLSLAAAAGRLCGLSNILAVTGHRRPEVEAEASALGLRTVFNPDYAEGGMFSSVQAGLRALEAEECFFILPVDAALVEPLTLLRLLTAWRFAPRPKKPKIIVPVFGGRCGHPPLIRANQAEKSLAQWGGPGGLRGWLASKIESGAGDFLKGFQPRTADQGPTKPRPERRKPFTHQDSGGSLEFLALDDPGILSDLDTPADLASAALSRREPEPALYEAWQLLLQSGLKPTKIRHHKCVAASALRLTLALGRSGENQADPELSLIAGLLHDLARNEKSHARAGREKLEALGWKSAALVVGAHTDPPAAFLKGLALELNGAADDDDEAYARASRRVRLSALALYLADKYWWDDEPVDIGQRFQISRRNNAGRDDFEKIIGRRQATALAVERWFRRTLGGEPEEIARQRLGDEREADLELLKI